MMLILIVVRSDVKRASTESVKALQDRNWPSRVERIPSVKDRGHEFTRRSTIDRRQRPGAKPECLRDSVK